MSRFNVGGTSQWIFQLSNGLANKGIENLLLVGDCPIGETEDSRLDSINSLKIKGLGPRTPPLRSIRAVLELRRIIKDWKPDIVNTHTSKAGVLGRMAAATIWHKPTIVHTFHGHVLTGYFNPVKEKIIKFIEFFLSLLTDFYLVSGEQVLLDLKQARVIRGNNYLNVWPGVPDFSIKNRENLRHELKISSNEFVVGWLGRKVPIKRLDRIIELAKLNPEVIFVVAGDGESIRDTYPEQFDSGILKNVIELGFTEPADVWAISDVCLITSDNEAIPISPIEASLARRPVIGIDAGSTREVIINGETGFLCSPEILELSNAVRLLKRDSNLCRDMGIRARDFAIGSFNPTRSFERQFEGYAQALKKH